MATTAELISQIYVGYFNRAPDPEGLNYWVSRYNAGMSLADIATSFSVQPESTALYAYLRTPLLGGEASFISAVYKNLFNRDTVDAEGMAYWTGQIASGRPLGEIILDIISGADATDAKVVANKVAAGLYWATGAAEVAGLDYENNPGAKAAAADALQGVDGTDASVVVSKAKSDAYFDGLADQTLTTGMDHITGTDGDDLFNAPLMVEIFNNGPEMVQTLQTGDYVDGGDGFDTLVARLNGTQSVHNSPSVIAPTLISVEKLKLTAMANVDLDLSDSTGIQEIHNVGSRYGMDIFNVAEAVDLHLDNVRTWMDLTYEGDVATQNVTANNVGTATNDFELYIDDLDGVIDELNLEVSNGVNLYLDAYVTNMTLAGSGALQLVSDNVFAGLETFDSTDFNEDQVLALDFENATNLQSLMSGDTHDMFHVNGVAFDGELAVDLGGGDNALFVHLASSATSGVNDLDFTGGVANVQTLNLEAWTFNFLDDVELNLDGFDDALGTVNFVDDSGDATSVDTNIWSFGIANGPETLTLNASDFYLEEFDSGNTVDLTINASDGDLAIWGINAPALETLSLNATNDLDFYVDSDADHDLSNLVNLTAVSAEGYADIDIDASDVDADVDALKSITATGADYARVDLEGAVGIAGVKQSQTVTITKSSIFATGSVTVVLPGFAPVVIPVVSLETSSVAAAFLANAINLNTNYKATFVGNVVTIVADDFGPLPAITSSASSGVGTVGATASAGVAGVVPVEGHGFAGLETVVVEAGTGDGDVYMTDVYGAFTVNASSAEDDVDVHLENTGVTSIVVNAADDADVRVYGGVIGNADLVDITITATSADVELADDLSSFTTLDVSAVSDWVEIDASSADFDVPVTYLIGATQDGTIAIDVDIWGAAAQREIYDFVGDNIGEVQFRTFDVSADPQRDFIDLSGFNIFNATNLFFTNVGGNKVVTAAQGQFDGSITFIGLGATAEVDFYDNIVWS